MIKNKGETDVPDLDEQIFTFRASECIRLDSDEILVREVEHVSTPK